MERYAEAELRVGVSHKDGNGAQCLVGPPPTA